ncbi:hypothetical protein OMAG_001915 [Candidatus Omnitrophus magneticus]|uniref:Uncharacterized protein n=1 Tax=Candidatus Omnitrophus magneticus TaxID=1609969 RepID=A0A0F0CRV4_9BACT|nr:hypothetical protein OMAG_001915 [Candidatus Omnitrophus magneticus]
MRRNDSVGSGSIIPAFSFVIPASSSVIPAKAGIHGSYVSSDILAKEAVTQLQFFVFKKFFAGFTCMDSCVRRNDRMGLGSIIPAFSFVIPASSSVIPAKAGIHGSYVSSDILAKEAVTQLQFFVFKKFFAGFTCMDSCVRRNDRMGLGSIIPAFSFVIPASSSVIPAKAGIHGSYVSSDILAKEAVTQLQFFVFKKFFAGFTCMDSCVRRNDRMGLGSIIPASFSVIPESSSVIPAPCHGTG